MQYKRPFHIERSFVWGNLQYEGGLFMKLKRFITILSLGVLLFSILNFSGSNVVKVANAATVPIKDTITLTVKFPDTIGEGFGVEPTDPEEIHMMINTEGEVIHNVPDGAHFRMHVSVQTHLI